MLYIFECNPISRIVLWYKINQRDILKAFDLHLQIIYHIKSKYVQPNFIHNYEWVWPFHYINVDDNATKSLQSRRITLCTSFFATQIKNTPISWWWWEKYFEPYGSNGKSDSSLQNIDLLKDSFAVHYWNHCRTMRSTVNRCVTGTQFNKNILAWFGLV